MAHSPFSLSPGPAPPRAQRRPIHPARSPASARALAPAWRSAQTNPHGPLPQPVRDAPHPGPTCRRARPHRARRPATNRAAPLVSAPSPLPSRLRSGRPRSPARPPGSLSRCAPPQSPPGPFKRPSRTPWKPYPPLGRRNPSSATPRSSAEQSKALRRRGHAPPPHPEPPRPPT